MIIRYGGFMSTRHLVHPTLLPVLDLLPEFTLDETSLPVMRSLLAGGPIGEVAGVDGVVTVAQVAPGPVGSPEVRVLVSTPLDVPASAPALLWIHGGGYVMGSAAVNTPLVESLATDLGCVVVSVDYRLAPETPHPGLVEDCYAALAWLHAQAPGLGVDPTRVALAGESAGGGLAAALALLVRDRGQLPAPVLQALLYPMLDDRTVTAGEENPTTGEFIWTREANRFGWTSLLGHEPGLPDVSPYAAAARAGDLADLPPTFLAVGALDLFLDEDLAYAQRLLSAGVPTELVVQPGAVHGYLAFVASVPGARVQRDLREALRAAFGSSAQ